MLDLNLPYLISPPKTIDAFIMCFNPTHIAKATRVVYNKNILCLWTFQSTDLRKCCLCNTIL